MPIYDRMLNLSQQKQQIESSQMLNTLRGVEIAQTIRANQNEDQAAKLIQQQALLRLAQRDRLQQTPGAKDAVEQQPPLLQESFRAMKQTQEEADYYRDLATTMQAGGGAAAMSVASNFQKLADKAAGENLQAQLRHRVAQQDLNKDIASTAGAYSDDTAADTFSRLDGMVPNWDRGMQNINRDPETGRPINGPLTAAAMTRLARQGESANNQQQRDIDAIRMTLLQQQKDINAQNEKRKEIEDERRDRRSRERLEERKREADARAARTTGAGGGKAAVIPEPTKPSIEEQAPSLARQLDVDPISANAAARDYLMEARSNRAEGMKPMEANAAALEAIRQNVHPSTDKNSKYKNTYSPPAPASGPLQDAIKTVTETGITVDYKDGKVKLKGPPTMEVSNAQQALDAATTDEQRIAILKRYAERTKK